MQDTLKLAVKFKKKKSVKCQIEEGEVLEAYFTHWQEMKRVSRLNNGRSREQNILGKKNKFAM